MAYGNLKTVTEDNYNTNYALAKSIDAEGFGKISSERHNMSPFAKRQPLKEKTFKYYCGVIVDIDKKTVTADMTAQGRQDAKDLLKKFIELGYKY